MEHLQRVPRLGGKGTVPGYPTLNVLGLGRGGRRGRLYHKLFRRAAPDCLSEPREVEAARRSVGAARRPLAEAGAAVSVILDAEFDDVAVWGEVWGQGHRLLCRRYHRDRWVETPGGRRCQRDELARSLRPLAAVEAAMVVKKRGQSRPKLQPVTATVSAVPLAVRWRPGLRSPTPGAEQVRPCWLVEARLERVDSEPWWLLTDRPVAPAAQAAEICRMYCPRGAIEDACKVAKTCLGGEDVRVLAFAAVRMLVALGWGAAGFVCELGATLEWGEVRRRRRLGGGEERPNRPPGKIVLTRGLRRLLDHLATEAILADEARRHGGLPPRIAAMLGRPGPAP
jgi:hypothetical protein